MFAEPAPTQFDLRFRLGSIAVRIHPFFWLVCLFLGWDDFRDPSGGIAALLIWIGCVFFSILLHELGHVLAMRWFGVDGHIVLHGFGGLAIPHSNFYGTWRKIFVSFAGPGAQFLLYGVLYLLQPTVRASLVNLLPRSPVLAQHLWTGWGILMWINWVWPLVNLLPIWPLDGGQISRNLFLHFLPRNGVRFSLYLSIAVAVIFALNSLSGYLKGPTIPWLYAGGQLAALFFGIMAANNIMELQNVSLMGARRRYEAEERLPWERDADWWKSGRRPYDD